MFVALVQYWFDITGKGMSTLKLFLCLLITAANKIEIYI